MRNAHKQWQFIERAAADMGVGSEARRKWRERGHVPHKYRLPLLQAAKVARVKLDPEIFDNVPDPAEEDADTESPLNGEAA